MVGRILQGVVVLFVLLGIPILPLQAADQTQSGSTTISGTVPTTAPTTPPTIDDPTQGATFAAKNQPIEGGCVADLIVKIFRNNAFAGSVVCQSNGAYNVPVDLVEGRNDLIARQYDSLNQPSPDSDTITVYYALASIQPSLPGDTLMPPAAVASFQLQIAYDYTRQDVFVNQPFRLPIRFVGGTPPYALSVNWGDGTSDIFSRENTNPLNAEHVYKKPGPFTIGITVSDRDQSKAALQFVVLVSGSPSLPIIGQFLASSGQNLFPIIVLGAGLSVALGGFAVGFLFHRHWWLKRLDK